MPDKVNIAEKLGSFSDHWAPRIVARYNDNEVRLVKVEGEFIWHKHDETDELFLILEGEFDMDFRDRTVTVGPGTVTVGPGTVTVGPGTVTVRVVTIGAGWATGWACTVEFDEPMARPMK